MAHGVAAWRFSAGRLARRGTPWALALALAACAGGSSDDVASDAAAPATPLVETDVEAPEVFQVTEAGLWDGRPSLGGVWVAHPDAVDPERVVIRNGASGATVIGALFRRERDVPGPALQVSSDAAAALSMLAGAPETLSVTALRRQEAPAEVEGLAEAVALAAPPVTASALPDAVDAQVVAPEAATDADLQRPLVQLGLFGVEANAEEAAAAMAALGLPARVAPAAVQGQPSWRVLVGPAATVPARDALLDRVRSEGFPDAFAVQG